MYAPMLVMGQVALPRWWLALSSLVGWLVEVEEGSVFFSSVAAAIDLGPVYEEHFLLADLDDMLVFLWAALCHPQSLPDLVFKVLGGWWLAIDKLMYFCWCHNMLLNYLWC